MPDSLQHSLHSAAAGNPLLRMLAVFSANDLIVIVGAAFLALAWLYRSRMTRKYAAKVALSGAVAVVSVLVLGPTIHDPRPYLAEHYAPLAHAASDNGFPSDHTLVVALLTGWLAWLRPARAALMAFVLGIAAVALGRLAIGAHHTLDVLGSVVIAALALGAASRLRLGPPWQRPLLYQATKSL